MPHAPGAIGPVADKEAGPHLRGQFFVAAAALAAWPRQPGIEAAPRDPEALRPKACHLAVNKPLQKIVAQKLDSYWSPQQIAGWLRIEYLDDRAMRVSHETIYKSLFIQARGVLKKELVSRLRSKRLMRRGKRSTTRGHHTRRHIA
jgi:IS30 family transposase